MKNIKENWLSLKKFLSSYWLSILIIFIVGLVLIPLLVLLGEHTLTGGWFSEAGNDGWLGFWGGFLGAIISVLGVYWSVNKTVKAEKANSDKMFAEEKEREYSQSRPFFLLQLNSEKIWQGIQYYYHFRKGVDVDAGVKYFYDHPGLHSKVPIITIKNISVKRMMAVKIHMNYKSDVKITNPDYYVRKVESDEIIKIILDDVLDRAEFISDDKKESREKSISINELISKLQSIDVIYTTELREVCKLTFNIGEVNYGKAKLNYDKSQTKLENKYKDKNDSVFKYTANGFYEDSITRAKE